MATLGKAIELLEAGVFVGRDAELAFFDSWLSDKAGLPQILNVSGHGGIGKGFLLRAFRRSAQELGRPVIFADSRDFPHTPEGFLGALGSPRKKTPLLT